MVKTKDVNNDIWSWNAKCGSSNLNGVYHQSASASDSIGTYWAHWHGRHYYLKATTMMMTVFDNMDKVL